MVQANPVAQINTAEDAQLGDRIEDQFNEVLFQAAQMLSDKKAVAELLCYNTPPADVRCIVVALHAFKTNKVIKQEDGWAESRKSPIFDPRTSNFNDIDINNLSAQQKRIVRNAAQINCLLKKSLVAESVR